jgi:hypothetical protein
MDYYNLMSDLEFNRTQFILKSRDNINKTEHIFHDCYLQKIGPIETKRRPFVSGELTGYILGPYCFDVEIVSYGNYVIESLEIAV